MLFCDDSNNFVGVEQRADAAPRLDQQALISGEFDKTVSDVRRPLSVLLRTEGEFRRRQQEELPTVPRLFLADALRCPSWDYRLKRVCDLSTGTKQSGLCGGRRQTEMMDHIGKRDTRNHRFRVDILKHFRQP